MPLAYCGEFFRHFIEEGSGSTLARRLREVAFGERASGTGFQVLLETNSRALGLKLNRYDKRPATIVKVWPHGPVVSRRISVTAEM